MLGLLWQSTSALHERFGNVDYTSVRHKQARWAKVEEEYREFQYAQDAQARTEEAVDLLVTVLGVLQMEGVQLEELEKMVANVIIKNNAKNEHTHELKDYKIVRRK